MVDPQNMSIEEILATCRRLDGGEGGAAPAAAESKPAEQPEASSEAPASESAAAPPAGKKAGEMSVAEMMAAARAEKSGGAAEKKAPAAAGKKPGEMSVAEMMAAARGEKAAKAEQPKAAPKSAAKPKPAADKSPAKASPKPAPSGPRDTASILAAARGDKPKPGPMSKAEAAAKSASEKKAPGKPKLEAPPMPEKPAYARPTAPSVTADAQDRRSFFGAVLGMTVGSSLAVGFSTLAVTHILWLLGLARFMFPNILTEPPTQFKVGFPDEYAPGQVETKYKAGFGVWIVRYEYDGVPQIYALQSVCTHLGCTPNWLEGEQKFKCPCHGSGFYKDGVNFEGPAPRPLERYAIRKADDGQLEVDKSRKFFQEKGDWSDPSSFVPV